MNPDELYAAYIEEVARRHRAELFWLKGETFRPWATLSERERAGYHREAAEYIEAGRDEFPCTVDGQTVSYR